MANEVKTIFTGDASSLFRVADQVKARVQSAAGQFANAGNPAQITQNIVAPIKKAGSEIADIERKTAQSRLASHKIIQNSVKAVSDFEIREAKRSANALISEFKKAEQERKSSERRITSPGGGFGGLGSVSGALQTAGAVLGIGAFVSAAKSAVDVAVEASRANRILASSAIEAGLSYDQAADKSKRFADLVGLSNTDAKGPTASILRLAGRTGKPENADKLLSGFADLSAAFGIDPKDLQTLTQSILSGQDEGLNRLGIADPGQLYKAYAKEIGKTADQLTQFEKVQAAVNAVLEKSATFAGAAADKQNSLEGRVLKVSAAWDNLTESLAQNFATSGPVTAFINEANNALGNLSLELENVNKQLAEGKSPKEIAKQRGTTAADVITGALTAPFATALLPLDILTNGFQKAGENFRQAVGIDAITERNTKILEDEIANKQRLNEKQELAAKQAQNSLKARIQAEEKVTKELERQNVLKKVDDFNKTQTDLFATLTQKSNSTNPFVALYLEADKALEQLRINTKGLSDDLRSTFAEMQVQQNQLQRFTLRLDTALDASDLRDQAKRFRNQAAAALTPEQQKARIDRQFSSAVQPGGFFGFNAVDTSQFSDRDRADIAGRSAASDALQSLGNNSFNLANQGVALAAFRSFQTNANDPNANLSTQERLDRQFGVIDKAGGTSAAEKAIVDRKIIALAGNDPTALRSDQRERVAASLEREADRKIRAEQEALDVFKQVLETNKVIAENGKRLVALAEKGGTKALDIILKNETDGAADISKNPKAPTSRDTDELYDIGFAGGSNR